MYEKIPGSVLTSLCVLAATGCGTATAEPPVGDPAYVHEEIADIRRAGAVHVLEPRRLTEALPNRDAVVKVGGKEVRGDWSDLVAIGRVTDASPDEGVHYPNAEPTYLGDDEEALEIVDFDDPEAHERSAVVTVDTEWVTGDEQAGPVTFRLGVPLDADASAYLAGIRGMGEVVVLLDRIEDGRHQGEYHPILRGAGLGIVESGGRLSFDGLGGEEGAFVGETDTVAELRDEAGKPRKTIAY